MESALELKTERDDLVLHWNNYKVRNETLGCQLSEHDVILKAMRATAKELEKKLSLL